MGDRELSGSRRPVRAPPTVLYWAEGAGAIADEWNGADRPFSLVAVEGARPAAWASDVAPPAIDCVVLEVPPERESTARLDALRERVGSLPTIVATVGRLADADLPLPAGIAGYVTISPSQDRVTLLDELSDRIADVVAADRDGVLLGSLLEQIPLSAYVKDRAGRHLAVSDSMIDMVGKPWLGNEEGKRHHHPVDIRGKTDFDLYPTAMATETVQDDRAIIETGEPVENKVEHAMGEEGTGTYVLTSKAPWYDRAGTVRGIVGVTTEVSQRKRYEHQLRRQNERLRRLTTALDQEIHGALFQAREELPLARETGATEHFETLSNTLERIETVVENVLRVTRQGEGVTTAEPVSLATLAEAAFDRQESDHLSLEVRTDARVQADPGRLQYLLEQLFENAREHGPGSDAGAVTVTIDDLDGGFFVGDDGVGIDEADREAVFEPGLAGETDSGVGLNIVAAIADAHGWTVTIDESDRGGARIEMRGVERIDD